MFKSCELLRGRACACESRVACFSTVHGSRLTLAHARCVASAWVARSYLSNNQIAVLEVGAFDGCSKLTSLQLSNNKLSQPQSGALANLSSLTYLNLEQNSITEIKGGAFEGLSNVQTM